MLVHTLLRMTPETYTPWGELCWLTMYIVCGDGRPQTLTRDYLDSLNKLGVRMSRVPHPPPLRSRRQAAFRLDYSGSMLSVHLGGTVDMMDRYDGSWECMCQYVAMAVERL